MYSKLTLKVKDEKLVKALKLHVDDSINLSLLFLTVGLVGTIIVSTLTDRSDDNFWQQFLTLILSLTLTIILLVA